MLQRITQIQALDGGWKTKPIKANFKRSGGCFWSKCVRLPRPFRPSKKIDGLYGARVEIAAVAPLLRNDMSDISLLHASRESGQALAMTRGEWEPGAR